MFQLDDNFSKHISALRVYQFLFAMSFGVHGLGLFCDIFNGDSALYASIAKNMAHSGEWFILQSIMQDNWIDKPHFAFWIWAASIKIFGNSNFGFKLPSCIALLILLRYLFLYALLFYNRTVAWLAVLIVSTSLHIFIAGNDVRIDIFLISFMMASIYHYQCYWKEYSLRQLFIASIWAAVAVMTKGIYVLIPIGVSVLASRIQYKGEKRYIPSHGLLAFLVIIVGITPALYALREQFLHYDYAPILGQKASNYLQFFFWDSQFGRFQSNLGQVQSTGDPLFYLHTLLWAMAPWSLLLFTFFFVKKKAVPEYISISCLAVLTLILSFSKTQLSHHVLIVVPFVGILLANALDVQEYRKGFPLLLKIHMALVCIILLALPFVYHLITAEYSIPLICLVGGTYVLGFFLFKLQQTHFYISATALSALCLAVFLHLFFYPYILQFQAGKKANDFLVQTGQVRVVHEWYTNPSLFNFYTDIPIVKVSDSMVESVLPKGSYIYTGTYGKKRISNFHRSYRLRDSMNEYRTTVLTPQFLDFKTRNEALEKMYLLELLD